MFAKNSEYVGRISDRKQHDYLTTPRTFKQPCSCSGPFVHTRHCQVSLFRVSHQCVGSPPVRTGFDVSYGAERRDTGIHVGVLARSGLSLWCALENGSSALRRNISHRL